MAPKAITVVPKSPPTAAAMPVDINQSKEEKPSSPPAELTREEIISARSKRLKDLSRIYVDQCWDLMEEVKRKYREYYWVYGKSPFQEDHGQDEEKEEDESAGRCGIQGCKAKAMALTRFCHMHILSDPHQKLYKACNYPIKYTNSGPILCGKPTLVSSVPCYCSIHINKGEKHLNKAMKKAGATHVFATTKVLPKFNLVVAEYVKHIQSQRRRAKNAGAKDCIGK